MKYDVFISYSRKDSEIVKKCADELGKAGYSVWMDKDGIRIGGLQLLDMEQCGHGTFRNRIHCPFPRRCGRQKGMAGI